MALKPFHIVLISAAILLGVGMGYWGFSRYPETQNLTDLQTGVVSVLIASMLAIYLVLFLKKMRQKGW